MTFSLRKYEENTIISGFSKASTILAFKCILNVKNKQEKLEHDNQLGKHCEMIMNCASTVSTRS